MRASAVPSGDPHRRPGRVRVLVAEDSPALSWLLSSLLRHLGFEVTAVLDGHRVLPAARGQKPHFIILNIGLPGLDGYQIADLIRRDPDLCGAVITAISGSPPQARAAVGPRPIFDHYLTKPVGIEAISPLLAIGR